MRILSTSYKIGFYAILVLLFPAMHAVAQTGAFNPYSQLGIGLPVLNPIVPLASTGGGFNGMRSNEYINFYNPASYSAFDNVQLQLGLEAQFNTGTRGNLTRKANLAYLNQFALGIPILKERIGMTIGYTPYTQVGYNFGNSETLRNESDTIDVNYTYEGKGGTDRVFIGFGGSPVKGLSIGFNTYFYIGNLESIKTSYFPDNFQSTNVQSVSGIRIADFGFDFGAQYSFKLKDKYQFTFGGTYTLGKNMAAKRTLYARYFTGTLADQFFTEDTLAQKQKVKLRFPHAFGGGFSVGRPGVWLINADFNSTLWTGFRYASGNAEPLFGNSYMVSLGGEIKANGKNQKNIFNQLTYRIGARYGNSYLTAGGNPFQEVGISFGLGIPLLSNALMDKKLFSNLNVGVEYGVALPNNSAFTREQSIRLVFAINLKDNWFKTFKFK